MSGHFEPLRNDLMAIEEELKCEGIEEVILDEQEIKLDQEIRKIVKQHYQKSDCYIGQFWIPKKVDFYNPMKPENYGLKITHFFDGDIIGVKFNNDETDHIYSRTMTLEELFEKYKPEKLNIEKRNIILC